jgi:hypothetical protein
MFTFVIGGSAAVATIAISPKRGRTSEFWIRLASLRTAGVGSSFAPERRGELSVAADQQDRSQMRRQIVNFSDPEPAQIEFVELSGLREAG